jgi:hypothetical protein
MADASGAVLARTLNPTSSFFDDIKRSKLKAGWDIFN